MKHFVISVCVHTFDTDMSFAKSFYELYSYLKFFLKMYDNLFSITSGNFECHFKWKPVFGSEKRDAMETSLLFS
jgi:hypothetical protein